MFTERPKLCPTPTAVDHVMNYTGWVIIFIMWLLCFLHYSDLPDIVPIHFNAKGVADGYGDKSYLFGVPLMALVLYVGIGWLNKRPYYFNYLQKITSENAENQYRLGIRMNRWLQLALVIIFGILTYNMIETGKGTSKGIGIWFLPITLALFFIPMIYFLFKMGKKS